MMTPILLYIENDPAHTIKVENMLRQENIIVLTAHDGYTGIAQAMRHHPHLILMDFKLPDIEGAEVLRRLRTIPDLKHTPVVMLTTDATPETQQCVENLGCNGYRLKPFDKAELLETIQKFLV